MFYFCGSIEDESILLSLDCCRSQGELGEGSVPVKDEG